MDGNGSVSGVGPNKVLRTENMSVTSGGGRSKIERSNSKYVDRRHVVQKKNKSLRDIIGDKQSISTLGEKQCFFSELKGQLNSEQLEGFNTLERRNRLSHKMKNALVNDHCKIFGILPHEMDNLKRALPDLEDADFLEKELGFPIYQEVKIMGICE